MQYIEGSKAGLQSYTKNKQKDRMGVLRIRLYIVGSGQLLPFAIDVTSLTDHSRLSKRDGLIGKR